MSKQALILVDIQNDYFPTGKWPLEGVEAAADNAVRVLQACRRAGNLVVHIRHEAEADDAPFFVAGSVGAQLHEKVLNQGDEVVVVKHFINAFRETGLKALLDQQGVEELVIAGSMSHMCIDGITRAAVDYGYPTRVIHDACATRDLQFKGVTVPAVQVHAAFMAALEFGYAQVLSTADYLAAC
ncbi:MAG: cysteine hydrolase family protein [Pseudomonas sp.]|uniref:cysteine hydrolase family protein n=1 Tax=Pseudomonas sp. TaxID=306 RepID=UPI003393E994